MKNLRELFDLYSVEGDVGVEVEVESKGNELFRPVDHYWRIEGDGSLRGNAAEYVLMQPCKINEVKDRLDYLSNSIKESGAKIDYSFRAGVHIHVNVQELNIKQMITFASVYFILEECLVDWCGEDRVGNHFCLRACDAEYVIDFVSNVVNSGFYDDFMRDEVRYASLNFTAIPKYGSLEFRALATEEDFSRIEKWAKILHHIKMKSLEYEIPQDILYDFSVQGPEGWARSLLGDYFQEIENVGGVEQKLINGMRLAQDLIYQSGV